MPSSSRTGPPAFPGSVGESPDRLVQLAPVVAPDHRLDDLDPAVRAGQRVLELGPVGDPPVRRTRGRAERRRGRRRGACRRAGRTTPRAPALPARASRRSSRRRRWRPRSSGRVGAPSGPMTRAVASCRKVTSPTYAIARVLRRRPSAAPIAVETVPSMPARPRLASTIRCSPTGCAVAIRSRSRIGLLAPTKSSPPGGLAALTTAATSYGVRPGCSATKVSIRRPSARSAVAPLLEPGRVVGLGGDGDVLGGDGRGPVGPATLGAHRDDLDVLAREQPHHRPGQRRVPEDDDPLDARAEVGAEQQPVGADRVRARPRPAARLGEQRPAGPLGQRPRRRPRVVPGDHDRPRPELQQVDLVVIRIAPPRIVRAPRLHKCRIGTSGSDISTLRSNICGIGPGSGDQRLVELAVQVDRAAGEPGGVEGVRGGGVEVGEAGRVAEEAHLVGGLVGAGAAEAGGAVGGDRDEGYAGMGGLEHGRVQVGRRRAGRRHHGDRPA